MEAVGRIFKPLWRPQYGFEIREAGDHVLLFVFELQTDVEWVLATKPWSFDKHVVLFHCYDYLIPMKNLRFTSMKFWVQMCGLAISMLNSKTAMELGEKIGVVLSMKHSDEMI